MAWWNKKKDDDEEESTAPSSSNRVVDAVKNLYQRVADNQRRAVEADQAVAREQAAQVQNAGRNLYSAYQQGVQSATQANMAAQRAQAQRVQQAAGNIYSAYQQQQEAAARANMAVQQEQARRVQNAARSIYGALQQQQEQAARLQMAQDDIRRASYAQAQERRGQQIQMQMQQQTAQDQGLQGIYSAAKSDRVESAVRDIFNASQQLQRQAIESNREVQRAQDQKILQGALETGKAAFNAIPKAMAKGAAISDEDAMRERLRLEGYSDKAIDEMAASGMVDPSARYNAILPGSFVGQVAANYNIGDLQQRADILIGQGIIQGNQEWIQRGQQLREMAARYAQNNQEALGHDSGLIGNMLAENMAQYAPQFFYQQAATLPAQILPALFPSKTTEALAQAFGSGSLSYTTMAGAAYADLVELGAEPEKAAKMAKDEAAISSVIESGDTFFDMMSGPLEGLNPFADLGEKASEKIAGRLAIGFGKWAGNVGQEYAEEALQEMVSMANERRLADGAGDGGVMELLGYFFDEIKSTAPELYDLYKKDALGVFFNTFDGAKEKFPDLYDEYQGIEPTENAARVNEAGKGGAVIGGFMGLFGEATGAVRGRFNRTQVNKAFDSLVNDTDPQTLTQLTDEDLAGAMQTALSMDRTDAAEILETELARRNAETEAATQEQTAPMDQGVPAPFEGVAPERQAAVEQAAQDIRNAAQQGMAPPIERYEARTNENAPTEGRGAVNVGTQGEQQIEKEISPEDIQGEPVTRNKTAEESMTMDQARRMIDLVFNEYVRQEGEYRTAEEWAQNADVGDVATLLENSENAVDQYLNKIPELWDDFDVEDIVEAYRAGTLTGSEKQSPVRMDTSVDTGRQDNRFYAPRIVNSSSETWDLANQRVTNENREAVYQARKDLLFFAHQPGAAEELGITQKELNARLRSWSNYSANGRAVSQRINEGVAPENQWYGIQNCSAVSKATVTDADIESMVKAVEGESDDYRRNYVGRTMLALDTHIDWSGLTIRFLKGQADPNDRSVRGSYDNSKQIVTVGGSGDSNTVAHEMGHALDGLWGRQIFGGGYLSQKLDGSGLTSPEAKQFFNNFKLFIESLNEKSDIRSSYTGRNTEVFARFVARFVEWADSTAGNRFYSEASYYKDGFTQAQFVEFAKLLQEKSALEAMTQNAEQAGEIEDAGPMAEIDIPRDYITYGNLSAESKKTKEAIQRLRDKGQYVNISYKDLEGLPGDISGDNYKAKSREVFRKILRAFLGKDLELKFDGNSAIVYLSSSGVDHAVVANYSQFKAATYSKLRRLLRNTEYAFSTQHDTEHRANLKEENAEWDTFVSLARLDGEELPVIFRIKSSDREVRGNLYDIIANENLYDKKDGSSRDAGQGDLGKSSSYGGTPSSGDSITNSKQNSNPQNEGRASIETPGDLRQQVQDAYARLKEVNPDTTRAEPDTANATEEELRAELEHLNKAIGFFENIEEASENLQVREDQSERRRLLDKAIEQIRQQQTETQREAERFDAEQVAEWTTPKKGIDINPDETESAVSSAVGLTEEDNEALGGGAVTFNDGTFSASDLFGKTAEQQETKAAEQAGKTANEALSQYIEDLPDDPMDLYTKQQKVTTEKKGEKRITTRKGKKDKTLRQKVSEGWHGFIRLMANDGDAIHQAGRQTGNKALDGMFFYAKAARQRAQDWIQGKRMSFGLDKTGDSLNSIFDPIRAKGDEYYKDFQLFLYHRLNVERMSRSTGDEVPALKDTLRQLRQKAQRHGIDLGSMTDDELQRRAQAYKEGGVGGLYDEIGDLASQYWETKKDLMRAERQQNKPVFGWDEGAPDADESKKISGDLLAAHPEFEQEAQKVYDYIDDLLQYRVDAGLITQADMDNLKSIYPHYVPVMYDYEDAPQEIRKGGLTVSSTIKKAKGGDTTLLPLHYALARQTLSVMRNAGFQQLGGTVLGEYENSGELMGKWVQDVKESEAAWDPSMADNEVPQTRENVVTVFRDGKRYDMTLSPDMAYAFNSLQPSGENNALEQFAAGANNMFKALWTSKSPLFVFTNSMRDFQEALFYSTDTARWIKNFPRAYKQIAGNGKYWQMYQAMGGVYNSLFDWATGEDIGDKGGKPGKVEMLNMWVEQAPRLSEFMTVLENAERDHGNVTQDDLMEAFNAAAEVTTNFSRGGTMGRYINRYVVPFWNPGVQGLSKVVRTATETRGFKNWATLALKTAVLGMLPQVLNGLLYRDDDEWDVIDDEVKANYYLFKSKDGVWVKIPKGRVLAALSVPVVGTMEALRGDDVDWGKLGKAAISSVAPNNPLTTNLFSPIVETRLWDPNDPGKTWYGRDIESKRLQSYAPGQRYDESTDAISKWIGEKLNVSPKKLSYILDQYSGALGDLVLPYLTPKAERGVYVGDYALPLSNAFMSRFTTDTVTSNTIGNEYYGLLDELTWKANAGDDAAAMAKKYMNRAGGTVSDYYAQIRKIENDPNLSDKEKTTLTRELRKQLNAYEQDVTADAQAYIEAHPESDYTDDAAVDAYVEGYNSTQTDEKNMITADDAARKMQDEVYREANRKHFGSEYALQVYNKDVFEKAQQANEDAGVSYDVYYDYYFGTKNLKSDKDENGKTISGSKKEKVVAYIDGMDIPDEQKDALYLASGYTENTLEDAPWNGGTGKYTGSSGSGSGRKKTPETRLKEYQDVQTKKAADPNYNPATDGHAWTVWADRAVESGIEIEDAIKHMTELGKFTADYDQYGKPITGSKKEKVVDYIQSQKGLTKAQKDMLYLYIYGENSLRFTPWHGWTGDKKKTGRRRGRRGGRRRSGGSTSRSVKQVGMLAKGYSANGIDVSALFGVSGSGRSQTQNASAASDLLEIINKHYGGNALAAAMDGGKRAKGRTTVDFKL